jgi:hypothetical protein
LHACVTVSWATFRATRFYHRSHGEWCPGPVRVSWGCRAPIALDAPPGYSEDSWLKVDCNCGRVVVVAIQLLIEQQGRDRPLGSIYDGGERHAVAIADRSLYLPPPWRGRGARLHRQCSGNHGRCERCRPGRTIALPRGRSRIRQPVPNRSSLSFFSPKNSFVVTSRSPAADCDRARGSACRAQAASLLVV